MAGSPVYSQLLGYATGSSGVTVELIPEVPAGKVYLVHYCAMMFGDFGPGLLMTLTINEVIPVANLSIPWDPITINQLVATDVRASINPGDGLFGWPQNFGDGFFTVAAYGQILTGPPVAAFMASAVRVPPRPSPEELAQRRRRPPSPVGPPAPRWVPIGSST